MASTEYLTDMDICEFKMSLSLCSFESNDGILIFAVQETDKLLNIANKLSNESLVTDLHNNGWHGFYLVVDVALQNVKLIYTQFNNIEKDDYTKCKTKDYEIEINKQNKEQLMWYAFNQYVKEVHKQFDKIPQTPEYDDEEEFKDNNIEL